MSLSEMPEHKFVPSGFYGELVLASIAVLMEDDPSHRATRFLRQERAALAQGSNSRVKIGERGSDSASIFSDLTGLPVNRAHDSLEGVSKKAGQSVLPESNVGFLLLKKSGWKEGTGLGISEQGRLNPVEAQQKLDRRGIGAEKKAFNMRIQPTLEDEREAKRTKQQKKLEKKALRQQIETEHEEEQEFAREFYREFWPENV